jgi:preprotein translocase subunit SecA
MDYLQEGIGLRAMAQRDPLVEYQREGYILFTAMNDAIKEESVGYVFNLEVQVDAQPESPALAQHEAPVIVAKGLVTPERRAMQYSAPTVDGEGGVEVRGETVQGSDVGEYPGTPKNAPCPCGSGKKYKRCHGAA